MNENDGRAERLQACLELIDAGGPVESALASLGDDIDLAAAALLGVRLKVLAPRTPRPAYRAALQAHLQDIGVAPELRLGAGRRRWAIRFAGALAAVTLALGSVVVASADSLPGGALYGFKLATERAQLSLADGPAERARLHLAIAGRRLAELHGLLDRGVSPPASVVEAWSAAHSGARADAAEAGDASLRRLADEQLAADRAMLGSLAASASEDTARLLRRYAGESESRDAPGAGPAGRVEAPTPTGSAAAVVPLAELTRAPTASGRGSAATASARWTPTVGVRAGQSVATYVPPAAERPTSEAREPERATSAPPAIDTPVAPEETVRPMGTAAALQTQRYLDLTAEPGPTLTPTPRWPWPWPRWPTPQPTQGSGPGAAPTVAAPTEELPEP